MKNKADFSSKDVTYDLKNMRQATTWRGEPVKRFHCMIKPIGPACNLNCTYCYYLSKKELLNTESYPRVSDEVLEAFIKQYIQGQNCEQIVFTWHGGEPTLLGLDFFKKVVALEEQYRTPFKRIENDLQTNGTLLDDEWCEFLRGNNFLVGLSIDGPKDLHDKYRMDKNQKPTFDRVFAAAKLLHKYNVKFNTLTVVNRTNAKRPIDVYKFLRDEVGSRRMQFLSCVEPKEFATVAPQHWDKEGLPKLGAAAARPGNPDSIVTEWSVDPDDYGSFLCKIFDRWYKNDVGKVFVYLFECAVGQWMGMPATLCALGEMCGKALAMEYDGTVYTCDHFVYPQFRLGNIKERTLEHMAFSPQQKKFGMAKAPMLPQYCQKCEFLFACNGGCPKDRLLRTPEGDLGLNYLCSGLKKYFKHIDPYLKVLAERIRSGELYPQDPTAAAQVQ